MMRFATSAPLRGGASTSSALITPVRHVRYANIQEALKPIAGQSAGQMSILNEICCNPDAEEERRKPVFRCEVAPNVEATQAPSTYLRTMYEWGYNSLTLFKKTNEDPGPWWNANSSTLVSNWSQVGDYANAGMWSGVWRYTYGIGEYNMRPWEVRGRAWGRKDKKSGAVAVRYGLAKAKPLQKLMFPHTPEHAQHRRIKHPASAGCREISALHGKRILREVQYHLGQGIRFYLVDGVFGSDPATCTPYRIITDNPTHAYFASLAAIRTFNYVARQEITLVKRVSQSPIDEWGWRRPGVLVYHAPSYDFEAPRIVEEFGGPRPQDLSLEHARFVAVEPYSIPMKAVIGGEPSCDVLLDTTALLCARWGFYADDKAFITLPGDSILAPDGTHATLIISAGGAEEVDALRASPHLLGARHHRLANGRLSRAWDVSSATTNAMAAGAQTTDLVEEDLAASRTQRVLPTRMGLPRSTSHRIFGRRNVSEYGFKHAHRYTDNAAEAAYAGGHLFSAPEAAKKLAAHPPRPSALDASMVDVVIIGTGKDASSAIIEVLKQRGMLYAEEEPLKAAMEKEMKGFRRVSVVAPAEAKTLIANLAKNGKA